ncbi:MAG TPA: biopolymer transporter ExbD [Vicinamibacteria bacterium]|nr:biopolymer transporter ExbD [Vicinamibacteria bacterium]
MGGGTSGREGTSRSPSIGGSATSILTARRGGQGTNGALSEINVTPFVDVMLVLLIIFMITAPMLMRAMDVSLPSATMRQPDAAERTVVSLDAQGRTFINDRAVNVDLLEEQLKMRVEVEGLRLAYLRADETLQYREIIRVMDIMKRAGIDTVGLAYVYPEERGAR